jgi:hypothetical protein
MPGGCAAAPAHPLGFLAFDFHGERALAVFIGVALGLEVR